MAHPTDTAEQPRTATARALSSRAIEEPIARDMWAPASGSSGGGMLRSMLLRAR